jgi:hypothetical protein
MAWVISASGTLLARAIFGAGWTSGCGIGIAGMHHRSDRHFPIWIRLHPVGKIDPATRVGEFSRVSDSASGLGWFQVGRRLHDALDNLGNKEFRVVRIGRREGKHVSLPLEWVRLGTMLTSTLRGRRTRSNFGLGLPSPRRVDVIYVDRIGIESLAASPEAHFRSEERRPKSEDLSVCEVRSGKAPQNLP